MSAISFKYSLSSINRESKKILQDISFHLQAGEVLGILGVNGAGKTTLLNSIIESPDELVELNCSGTDIRNFGAHKIAKLISHLGSADLSKPQIEVKEFLRFAFGKAPLDQSKVNSLLESIATWGLSDFQNSPTSQLSEGEFQRVLLATIFLQEADIYLLDEPERHLDPAGVEILERNCLEKAKAGKIVILASHDINLTLGISTRILGLTSEGHCSFNLSPEEIKNKKALDALYNVTFEYIYRQDGGLLVYRSASVPAGATD